MPRTVVSQRSAEPAALSFAALALALASLAVLPTTLVGLFVAREQTLATVPEWGVPYLQLSNVSWNSVIPPHPKNMTQAFELGRITEAIHRCSDDDNSCVTALLNTATALLAADQQLTIEDIERARHHMQQMEQERGFLARISGAMSFINIMYLVGAIGFLATVIPCVYAAVHLLGLTQLFGQLVKLIVRVVVTTGQFLYTYTAFLWCPAGYVLLACTLVDAARKSAAHPTLAAYVAVICLGLFAALSYVHFVGFHDKALLRSLFICIALVARTFSRSDVALVAKQLAEHLMSAYLIAVLWLTAVIFQSQLIGFLTIAAVFSWLGFMVLPTGLCYYIGFSSDTAMYRAAGAGVVITVAFLIVKVRSEAGLCLQASPYNACFPFISAAHVLGCVAYFLASLIASSRYYDYKTTATFYWWSQCVFIGSCVLAVAAGQLFHSTSMYATATVFGVLYVMEKITELSIWKSEKLVIIAVSVCSWATWRIASYLASRPDVLAVLLQTLSATVDDSQWPGLDALWKALAV